MLLTAHAHATTLTLNNNNPTPGQYTTFDAAQTAAATGDTILVHGSPTSYGTASITKKLTIIGPGHKPRTTSGLAAKFGAIWISNNTSGVNIHGLKIDYVSGPSGGFLFNVDTLTIENTFFLGNSGFGMYAGTNCNYIRIRNSVLEFAIISFGDTNVTDVVLENNYITAPGVLAGWGGSGNKLVSNNIFTWSGAGTVLQAGSPSARNTLFRNNIFYGMTPNGGTQTDCLYANNLTFGTSNNNMPPAGQGGSNNLINVNPQFVNVQLPNQASDFDYTRNYRLQPASPAKGAGEGGTDIGLYEPDFEFSMTGEPARPQALSITPNPVVVPSGGTTTVNFTIRKSTVNAQ